jgi:glycosyltransferase involved in cell wall biosynthesis
MKVLMLSDLFAPVIGGGQRHVQLLSRELAERGHEVVVCTIGHPSLPKYEEEEGVKVYRLKGLFQRMPFLFRDPTRQWHPPTPDWLVNKEIKRLLFNEKPDIVHVHGRILYSMLPLKNKYDIPLVVTLHAYWAICPTSNLRRGNVLCDRPLSKDCISCSRGSYGVAKCLAVYLATKLNMSKLKLVDKFIAVKMSTQNIWG